MSWSPRRTTASKRWSGERFRPLPEARAAPELLPSADQPMSAAKESGHFIPLQTAELLDLLCGDRSLPEADRDGVRRLAALVQGLHHLRFHRKQVELKNAYEPFDPDTDDAVLVRLSATQK